MRAETLKKDFLKIGGASGYWGDASQATEQLLTHDDLDFIVYDYLAEITMAIMARVKAKDPNVGYATDFISEAMVPNLKRIFMMVKFCLFIKQYYYQNYNSFLITSCMAITWAFALNVKYL